MPNDRLFREKLDALFADVERPATDPAGITPSLQRAREKRARLCELEAKFQESEKRAAAKRESAPSPAAPGPEINTETKKEEDKRSAVPILYEKEHIGFAYSGNRLQPLGDAIPVASTMSSSVTAPLTASGQTIGRMQVEPAPERKWTPEETALLNAVAQQASVQIQNLRLLATTERARAEAENATRRFIHENWDSFLDGIHHSERVGYAYDQATVIPFADKPQADHGIQESVSVMEEQVGMLYLQPDPTRPLTNEDRAMVTAIANQVAQQVENLRLLADAARARAEAEEATRRLTRESWRAYTSQQDATNLGFVYDSNEVTPLTESFLLQNVNFTQPLTVRGETIGQLAVANWKDVSPEAADLAAAIAAQTSIHLETLRLNEELRKRAEELEKLDKLKSAFLANMSHELRTPLNSILGFSDVMLEGLDGPLTDVMENDLKLISRNGQHLLSLINDVLDMAKITAGKMNLNVERFNLHEVLADVVNITTPLARDKSLTLQLEAEASSALELEADRTRLRQVMINLVGNAIKFTEAGSITVSAARHDGRIRINVRDTGIGVTPDQAQLIFEEFGQVDTSTTRKTGGTGLGLPISRKLIELHGGQLWVESTGVRGEGSTFVIELPMTREAKDD